jgi:hypothetical protein
LVGDGREEARALVKPEVSILERCARRRHEGHGHEGKTVPIAGARAVLMSRS